MNILEFVKFLGTQVRTSAGQVVTIDKIVPTDQFPIKGVVHHDTVGVKFECEWDAEGFPHKLPLTHGLNLNPYLPQTIYQRVDKDLFKSANSYADLVRNENG